MPINPGQGQQMGNPLDEINSKLDAIMEHLGCDYKGVNQDEYMNMSDDEKDQYDQRQVMGKK